MAEPSPPTPEQREARIAELRVRRRARMRTLALRSAVGTGALVLLVAAIGYWALMTLAGRQFLLAQLVARLPAGTDLSWQRAEGPAAGPLQLHGLRLVVRTCPERDGQAVPFGDCEQPLVTTFTARRVLLDADIRPLFGKLLRLDALEVEGATLDLPRDESPFELPRWPEVLPELDLPLGLQADRLRVDGLVITRAGAPLIDITRAGGGIDARRGRLRFDQLRVDSNRGAFRVHGDYAPARNYATDLTASALLPASGGVRARIGLVARGDLQAMRVAVRGHAPAPLLADLRLDGGKRPRWTLRADSKAVQMAAFTGGPPVAPLAFDVFAAGIGGKATLRGQLRRDGLSVVLQPSVLVLEDEVLELRPLVVDVQGGRVVARGRADFSAGGDATVRLALRARGLDFGGTPAAGGADPTPAVRADADIGVAGTLASWAATGAATFTRAGEQATLEFKGRGDGDGLRLGSLRAAMPTGRLEGRADLAWAPTLRWNFDARLAGFDPGYFAPGWDGAVSGAIAGSGTTRDDGGLDVRLDAERLTGRLRGRALEGRARLEMQGPAPGQARTDYAGDIALSLGGSRVEARGTMAATIDIDARLSPLNLADLLPAASGVVRGRLALSGPRTAPDIAIDLSGQGLRHGEYAASSFSAEGRLPWARGAGALRVRAQDLVAGVALDSLRVDARGAVENLRLDAAARGPLGSVDLAGGATRGRGGAWQGTLDSLTLDPARGAAWRLQAPARFAQLGQGFSLSSTCLTSGGRGSLCASADWPRIGVAIRGSELPLALVAPYLPPREDGAEWRLAGVLAVEARIRPVGDAYQGSVRVTSPEGGLRLGARARRDLLAYRDLVLEAEFDPRRIRASVASGVNGDGRVNARVETGWDAYAPTSGELTVAMAQLTWLELFSPDIVDPTGRLEGRITLGGSRAEPVIGGRALLSDFSTEVPALGLVLREGRAELDARADGSARITGSLRSGEGRLTVDGSLGWRANGDGDTAPLVLNVGGRDVLVSDTRDLRAVATPELVVRASAGQALSVTGTVTVPSAMIDLERLDRGVSASPDVVVLDPVEGAAERLATPVVLDLSLVMGDDVRLRGFGLDGSLGGRLRVRAQPGREMTAVGVLNVGGEYTAYGQDLEITRGRLQWSNGPVSDPILDIRAEREIEARGVTAGIDVGGRASSPQARVWSDPATSQSDALSYLTLGRPSSSLSGEEGQQINAATAALNAGGNLLAARLGSRIGLDDAGISGSRALGGSVLGIGKQLSPRLYVGFGVSLLGTGQVLTLKYLLSRGFDIEIESSTLENRGSLNWRKEK